MRAPEKNLGASSFLRLTDECVNPYADADNHASWLLSKLPSSPRLIIVILEDEVKAIHGNTVNNASCS